MARGYDPARSFELVRPDVSRVTGTLAAGLSDVEGKSCCFPGGDGSDSDSASDSSQDGLQMKWHPLIRTYVEVDDGHATLVFVFTRAKDAGGTVRIDPRHPICDPSGIARRIFPDNCLPNNWTVSKPKWGDPNDSDTWEYPNQPFVPDNRDYVDAAMFHHVVRQRITELLERSGLRCESFLSLDGDETFLKVYLDECGQVARDLAASQKYRIPLDRRCYTDTEIFRISNRNGEPCFAHTPFTNQLHDEGKVQHFRPIDIIRLTYAHVATFLNLHEMEKQDILVLHFPVATWKEMEQLRRTWPSPLHCKQLLLPNEVRNYFGEKIAFFFHYFIFYVRALCILGFLALCLCWADLSSMLSGFTVAVWMTGVSKIGLSIAIVVWALVFELCLSRSLSRRAQVWGMVNQHDYRMDREDFRDDIVGTWREAIQSSLATTITAVWVLVFALLVEAIKAPKLWSGWRSHDLATIQIWAVSALISISKLLWGKVAPALTKLENHKTQKRFDDSLVARLAFFKILFFVWPPISIFVIDSVTHATCGTSLEEAAHNIWGPDFQTPKAELNEWQRWPEDIALNASTYESYLRGYTLSPMQMTLRGIISADPENEKVCISGCLPHSGFSDCQQTSGRYYLDFMHDWEVTYDCESYCMHQLKQQLLTQFLLHVVTSIVFLLIPLAQTYWEVRSELVLMRREGQEPSYTLMQIQAKAARVAPYKYHSWGGSFVEDFLELMMGYAYISIFGMVMPTMIVIAAVAQVIEYQLLVMRMRLITGRPYPAAEDGIGAWRSVITMIGTVAVFLNGYIAAFVMRPMVFMPIELKFLVFLAFGSLALLFRTVLRNSVPDEPHDVKHIGDFNRDKLKQVIAKPQALTFEKRRDGQEDTVNISLF